MSADDLGAVTRLWRKTEGVGLDRSDAPSALRHFLVRNPQMSFVARRGRSLVGAVLCGHDGRRGALYHLAVAREHRGRGLGPQLVEACLGQLEAAGIHKCNIHLFSNNSGGELFWKKNGWHERDGLLVFQKAIIPSEVVVAGQTRESYRRGK